MQPHILKLGVEGRFPRLWTPDWEQRDVRQLGLHRHKLVEVRGRVKNELQHLSMNKGIQKKRTLWSQAGQKMLRELPLKTLGLAPSTHTYFTRYSRVSSSTTIPLWLSLKLLKQLTLQSTLGQIPDRQL